MVTFFLTVLFVIYLMPSAYCRMSNFRFNPTFISDVFACIFTENSSARQQKTGLTHTSTEKLVHTKSFLKTLS